MRLDPPWYIALRAPGATAAAVRLRFPPLAKTPLILATTEGYRRVACASRDALEHGVQSGMPVTQARRLCGRVIVLEYSPTVVSAPARLLAKTLACDVQAAGHDQFALLAGQVRGVDLFVQHVTACCSNALNVASSLKAASSLLWARVGLEYGDRCPDIIPPGREAEFLSDIPLSSLKWLPAPGIAAFARQWSVFTLGDLAAVPVPLIKRLLGREAVELTRLERHSKSAGLQPFEARVTLAPATNSNHAIRRAMLGGIDRVWTRLRRTTEAAAKIEVTLHGSDGRVVRRRAVLHPEPEDPVNLGHAAVDLLRHVIMRHAVGAVVVRVWPGCSGGRQLSLFPLFSSVKSERLGYALTELAARFGANTVTRAATLLPSAA